MKKIIVALLFFAIFYSDAASSNSVLETSHLSDKAISQWEVSPFINELHKKLIEKASLDANKTWERSAWGPHGPSLPAFYSQVVVAHYVKVLNDGVNEIYTQNIDGHFNNLLPHLTFCDFQMSMLWDDLTPWRWKGPFDVRSRQWAGFHKQLRAKLDSIIKGKTKFPVKFMETDQLTMEQNYIEISEQNIIREARDDGFHATFLIYDRFLLGAIITTTRALQRHYETDKETFLNRSDIKAVLTDLPDSDILRLSLGEANLSLIKKDIIPALSSSETEI